MRRWLTLSLLVLPVSVFAQDTVGTLEPEIVYEKETRVDFERPVDVDGQLLTPNVKMIIQTRSLSFNPLIKLRTTFDVEMARSVDQVK